jgi:hypothetical protein
MTAKTDPVEVAASQAAEAAVEGNALRAKRAAKRSEARSDAMVRRHADAGNTSVREPKAKAAPKAAAKPAANGATKKEGLRKAQVRILKALLKAGRALTRKELAEKAPVDVAACVEYVGSSDPDRRAANDTKHFPSLVTLGYVRFGNPEEAGGTCYEITAKGRAAAAKAE